ncbi:hypothetical protein ACFPK1_28055 [Actinomycetospora rhizophila]|jgi:hypothetical protein|uniref:Uncharacterized protein n=1 Tax=Actinomycetospora rhizophila TaxID=1416876 RepID=A0ABV9ZKU1_9PSEU
MLLRSRPALGLLVLGLLLLVAPLAVQAFAVVTLLGALAAWRLSDRLARRLPEEDGRGW